MPRNLVKIAELQKKINEQEQEIIRLKDFLGLIEDIIQRSQTGYRPGNTYKGLLKQYAESEGERELLELAKKVRGIPKESKGWQVVLVEADRAERDRMAEDDPQKQIENFLEDLEKEGLRLIIPSHGEYKAILVKKNDYDHVLRSNREALKKLMNDEVYLKACDNFIKSPRGQELEKKHAEVIKKREIEAEEEPKNQKQKEEKLRPSDSKKGESEKNE